MLRTAALALVLTAGPLAAQTYDKSLMLADWQRAKSTVLAYVNAMPDSALGFRATPGVRTFAEQIEHIVGTHLDVAAAALNGVKTPQLGDSAKFLHDKAALRTRVTATFDYMIAGIRAATPAQLAKSVAVFGLPAQPAWRWVQLSHEHGAWTLGQTVPYLRLNKVTPPEYQIPF